MTRAVLLALMLTSFVGCHRNQDAEGPMERAGRNVDRAADKTGKALGKAAEKTGEAFEKAGKKLKGNDATPPERKPSE